VRKQLRTRILTALVFAPLLLAIIFLASQFWFSCIMALLFLYAGWEFSLLCNFRQKPARILYTLCQALILAGGLVLIHNNASAVTGAAITQVFIAIALTALWGYSRFGSAAAGKVDAWWSAISAVQGLVLISGAWLALSWLRIHPQGSWWILLLLVIIWVADVAAYFTGRKFGKRKLAPAISPGKTWAGVAGAAVIAPLAAIACIRLSPLPEMALLSTVLLTLLTVTTSIGGDLFISLHKRAVGVKDSGKLFPGHGGVLDRFDSLISGSVFFVLGMLFLRI